MDKKDEQEETITTIHLKTPPPNKLCRSISARSRLRHETDLLDRELIWTSPCGLQTDARACRYITKSIFSAITLGFCFFGLVTNDDPCSPLLTFYSSTISLIAGSYLEQGSSSTPSSQNKQ